MRRRFSLLVFLNQVVGQWQKTGAVLPSSRYLARAITSIIEPRAEAFGPRRILEVGAGTGVFTAAIVRRMGPDDKLVVYEMNADLARVLRARCRHDKRWRHLDIEVREMVFPEGTAGESYDAVICGLPFNNFPSTLVRHCFRVFAHLLAGGGKLAYFEYCHLRRLKLRMVGKREFLRLKRIEKVTDAFRERHGIKRITVARNVPPAWVHVLEFGG